MRAVWSFWTKPYFAHRQSSWHSDGHHFLAWGLSFYAARQHYPETQLITDDDGARILIDELQLPFGSVSTGLNKLKNEDPEWWALGKIEAYRRQEAPFVHLDTDVFLWNRLNEEIEQSDVFAQNPEPIVLGDSCYRPSELEAKVEWLPDEWIWYLRNQQSLRAECCGIFGGSNIEFIQDYASKAMQLVTDPRNRLGLASLSEKPGHMILIEQLFLTACIEHRRNIEIRYIFDSIEDAYNPDRATEAGFTHLAAGAKRNARICRQLERRVQRELPEFYERCVGFLNEYAA